jgi:alcohol dehydrogenase class IV
MPAPMKLNIETFFNSQDVKRVFFPGKIFWGRDCRYSLFDLIDPDMRIALFLDRFFAGDEFVKEVGARYGKGIVLREEIEGRPTADNVRRIGMQLGKAPDAIISIGGGSTIDTAKAVMAAILYGSFDGIGMGERRGCPTLPGIVRPTFFSFPTTAGSGADASRYYVVYDSKTGAKIHGKSWQLVADWIFLDTHFIENAPDRLLINGAFDAFVHLLESSLCRYERSWFGDMLAVDGMVRILYALDRLVNQNDRSRDHYLALLYASTLAGMAISNVRTGSMHEAGGAVLEQTELTHGETLFIFFRESCQQFAESIQERHAIMLRRLEQEYPALGLNTFEKIITWWEDIHARHGLTAKISREIKKAKVSRETLKRSIFDRVFRDKVWIEKESPFPLDRGSIDTLIECSLKRFEGL